MTKTLAATAISIAVFFGLEYTSLVAIGHYMADDWPDLVVQAP